MVEKLGNIYNGYTDLLAKDTKVEELSCSTCLLVLHVLLLMGVFFFFAKENVSSVSLSEKDFFCMHYGATQ